MIPGIPKIPPVLVAVCKLPENEGVEPRYFIEIEIGEESDRKTFRVSSVNDNALELFTKDEAKAFVESELPKVIRMAGGNLVFRENCAFQVSDDVLARIV